VCGGGVVIGRNRICADIFYLDDCIFILSSSTALQSYDDTGQVQYYMLDFSKRENKGKGKFIFS
jgi:hypothetical protein